MIRKTLPDVVVSTNDPGDDVQRRFRYQSTYAAILSLEMFEDETSMDELYCELHEDVLVKLKSGKFVGVQVKTRALHLGPFEFDDLEIGKSIKRFFQHEQKFENFERYTIATNSGFSKEKSKCLQTLINLAKEDKFEDLLKDRTKSKTWINTLAKECGCTALDIINILKKLKLSSSISSLDDIKNKLIHKLSEILGLGSQTFGCLEAIADEIIMRHLNASSLSNLSSTTEYFILSENPELDTEKKIIEGKKITKDCIEAIINKYLENPISIFIKDSEGIPSNLGVRKLEIKMDAGGISYDTIQLSKDQKYSMESLTASWLYKYDQAEAEKMYNQIKHIVNNESQEVYEELESDQQFGKQMLINVRQRLRERYRDDKESFFESKYEHLLGMVGILTEECKIWWSKKFDIS